MGATASIYVGPALVVKDFDHDRYCEFYEAVGCDLSEFGEDSEGNIVLIPNDSKGSWFIEECNRFSSFSHQLHPDHVNTSVRQFGSEYSAQINTLVDYCRTFDIKFLVRADSR